MADTMVERLTGQTAGADVNVELQIMMSLEALLDPRAQSQPQSRAMARCLPILPATL